jgi:multimeric flavodoxin WrbA
MKVLIGKYLRYGHILKMARAAGEGVKSAGVEAVLRRVEELPEIEKDIPKHK